MDSFSSWVKTQTHRWDSVGRLAREAFHNPNWPKDMDFVGCLTYLKAAWQGDPKAQPHLVNALVDAWGDFRVLARCANPGKQCSQCGCPVYPTDDAVLVCTDKSCVAEGDLFCETCANEGP